ncbi:MAG: hypothetical protein U1G08_10210 [Verrucomicrobiota bacterium]
MKTPAEVYRPSPRSFEGTPEALDYEGREIRRVLAHGKISFHGHGIYISGALAGWDVGLGDQHGERIELWFAHLLLGHLNAETMSFEPLRAGGFRPRGGFRFAPADPGPSLPPVSSPL